MHSVPAFVYRFKFYQRFFYVGQRIFLSIDEVDRNCKPSASHPSNIAIVAHLLDADELLVLELMGMEAEDLCMSENVE